MKLYGRIHYWGEMGEDVIDIAGWIAEKVSFIYRPICWVFGHDLVKRIIIKKKIRKDVMLCRLCLKRFYGEKK